MPQSRTRYQRAAMRSKYRKPKRRRSGSFGWNVVIAVVVIVGVVAVVLTRGGSNSAGSGPPRAVNQATNTPGDHWHTALDVNVCGEWLDPPPAFEKPYDSPNQVANAGIHSHGDGLIHTHPFVVSEEGSNATHRQVLRLRRLGPVVRLDRPRRRERRARPVEGTGVGPEEDHVEQRRHLPVRPVQGPEGASSPGPSTARRRPGTRPTTTNRTARRSRSTCCRRVPTMPFPDRGLHRVRPDLRPEHRRGVEQGLAVPVADHDDRPRDDHRPADVHAVTAASRANVVS